MEESITALVEWLDGGERVGDAYVDMHRRLVAYFSRKGSRTSEELADETLTRVARRLREEGAIRNIAPAQYCFIVARYVFLESLRDPARVIGVPASELPQPPAGTGADAADERVLTALDDCLGMLSADDRALLLEYYSGPGDQRIATRKALAARLGISANALTIRACRLRERIRAAMASRIGSR